MKLMDCSYSTHQPISITCPRRYNVDVGFINIDRRFVSKVQIVSFFTVWGYVPTRDFSNKGQNNIPIIETINVAQNVRNTYWQRLNSKTFSEFNRCQYLMKCGDANIIMDETQYTSIQATWEVVVASGSWHGVAAFFWWRWIYWWS